jgi:hypothetical protein
MKIVVKELPDIWKYVIKRNIYKQYKKVKTLLEDWKFKNIDFKLRQPKKYKVYQFKINSKYRGFWVFRINKENKRMFVVTEISDHQDY